MSRFLVDTSVSVPLIMSSHPSHASVTRKLGRRPLLLAGHAAVETYSVLTRLPGDARLSASDAHRLIVDRFVGAADLPDPIEAIRHLSEVGVEGGATYDGLVALCVGPGDILFSRDLRASATYARVGVAVELIAS